MKQKAEIKKEIKALEKQEAELNRKRVELKEKLSELEAEPLRKKYEGKYFKSIDGEMYYYIRKVRSVSDFFIYVDGIGAENSEEDYLLQSLMDLDMDDLIKVKKEEFMAAYETLKARMEKEYSEIR